MQVCLRQVGYQMARNVLRVRCMSAIPAPHLDSKSGPHIPEHVASIAEQICKLSLLETSQLTALLKDKLGIGDIAVAAPVAAQNADAPESVEPEPVVEEKTIFDVKLVGVDPSMKIKLIKAMKEVLPDLNLVAAKKLVEAAPCLIREQIPKANAEELKTKLAEFGADIELE